MMDLVNITGKQSNNFNFIQEISTPMQTDQKHGREANFNQHFYFLPKASLLMENQNVALTP